MQKIILKLGLLSGAFVLLASGGSAVAISTQAQDAVTERKAAGQSRLAEDKLKFCKARETVMNKTMGRINGRGQNHVDVITKIAERVEAFYAKSGRTLSNYDRLVADVNAKKTIAQAAVDKVKADQADFNCDGNDPKGTAAAFKTDVKAMETAVHSYKMSVKSLITGVKSAAASAQNSSGGTR